VTFLTNVDPNYDVVMDARPSNYFVNHISWSTVPEALNWTDLVLVRKTSGYPNNPNDGVQIYTSTTDSVEITVTSVDSNGGITGSTLTYSKANAYTVSTTTVVTTTSSSINFVSSTTTPTNGRGASFTVTTNSSGSISTAVVNAVGSGYSQNDIIRISGKYLGSTSTSTTSLGVANNYHIFDTGTSTAQTTNSGYGVVGTAVNTVSGNNKVIAAPKYYYTLFARVSTSTFSSADLVDTAKLSKFYWKNIGQVSCLAVPDNGTLDILTSHLPRFYTLTNDGKENTDLKTFLSLLAFHIDTYTALNKGVLNLSNPKTADEVFLKKWIQQFGGDYSNVNTIDQARKLLKNISRVYQNNGSTLGLSELIESYTGYGVTIAKPKNILPDYDTSSFVNSTGWWQPDYTSTIGYNQSSVATTAPFTRTLYSPLFAKVSAPQGSVSSYFNITADPAYGNGVPFYEIKTTNSAQFGWAITAASTTSSTITYTVGSGHPFVLGQSAIAVGMAPSGYNAQGVITATTSTTVTISNNNVPGTATTFGVLSQVVNNGIALYVTDSSKIQLGSQIYNLTSGTSPAPQMQVTAVINSTTIHVNKPPTSVTSAGSSLAFSNNTTSNIGYVITESGSGVTASYVMGPRRAQVVSISSSTAIVIRPFKAKVGDYVVDQTNNSLPKGLYVSSIDSSTSRVAFKDKNGVQYIVSSIPTGTQLIFSDIPNVDSSSAITAGVAIEPNTPYAFGMYFNGGSGTKRTATVKLDWYDKNGAFISTSAVGTLSSASQTNNTWAQAQVSDLSPATAAFCCPRFDIQTLTTAGYWVDAAQLVPPIAVTGRLFTKIVSTATATTGSNVLTSVTSTAGIVVGMAVSGPAGGGTVTAIGSGTVTMSSTAAFGVTAPYTFSNYTLYTANPHNFVIGNSVTVKTSTSTYNTSNVAITAVYQNTPAKVYSFSYNGGTQATAETYVSETGYVSSVPVGFEDARTTSIKINPTRTNLFPNPTLYPTTSLIGFSGLVGSSYTTTIARNTSTGYVGPTSACLLMSVAGATSGFGMTMGTDNNTFGPYNRPVPVTVTPGNAYSFSAYLKVNGGSANQTFTMSVSWYDFNTNLLSTSTGTATSISNTAWTNVGIANALAPATASYAIMKLESTASSSASVYVDGILAEQSSSINPYFDGYFDGYSYLSDRDSMWEEEAGWSRSHLYQNRVVNTGIVDRIVLEGMYYA